MRREYIIQCIEYIHIRGLPLHAQGILRKTDTDLITTGITPACAGNTLLLFQH